MEQILIASEIGQWILLMVILALVVGVATLVSDTRRRLNLGVLVPDDGLDVGTAAPDFSGTDLRGQGTVRFPDHLGKSAVLAFLSPVCRPCVDLVPSLNELADRERATQLIAVIEDGDGFDFAQALSQAITVVADRGGAIQRLYQVRRSPFVYVIDEKGAVRFRSIPNTRLDLEDMLAGRGRSQGGKPWREAS